MNLNNMITSFTQYDYNAYDSFERHEANASWFDAAIGDGVNNPNLLKMFDGHTPIGVGVTAADPDRSPRDTEDYCWAWGHGNEFRINEYFESNTFAYPVSIDSVEMQLSVFGNLTRMSFEFSAYDSVAVTWSSLIKPVDIGILADSTANPIYSVSSAMVVDNVTKFRMYIAITGRNNQGPHAIFDVVNINGYPVEDSGLRIYNGSSVVPLGAYPLASGLTSSLRYYDGSNVRSLILDSTSSSRSSNVKIHTGQAIIKAP